MKNEILLQLSGTIEGISSRADRTWKLIVGTQELTEEQVISLINLNRKSGWFIFKENPLKEEDILDIPEVGVEIKNDKTPSQRLRNCLYILWEQKKPTKTFDEFYKRQMEKIISWVKEKLE